MGDKRLRQPFLFVGNHPCLDCINTQMIVRGEQMDLLNGFHDLEAWLVLANIVNDRQGEESIMRWDRTEQERLFDEAVAFRRVLRNMAERIVARKPIPPSVVAAINRILSQSPGYPQLVHTQGHWERRFHSEVGQSARLLTPLAEAASDLLCSGDLSLVKKCGNAACILYFYDTTKNHTRNWCSMQLCGIA